MLGAIGNDTRIEPSSLVSGVSKTRTTPSKRKFLMVTGIVTPIFELTLSHLTNPHQYLELWHHQGCMFVRPPTLVPLYQNQTLPRRSSGRLGFLGRQELWQSSLLPSRTTALWHERVHKVLQRNQPWRSNNSNI